MSLKRKPFAAVPFTALEDDEPARESPEELTRRLSGAVAGLPTTNAPPKPPPAPPPSAPEPEPKLPPSYPHSFKASPQMSRILHELTRDVGIRCWIASVLQEKGYQLPKSDLTPKKQARTF